MLRKLLRAWRLLAARNEFEKEMSEELRFHIGQYAQELMDGGIPEQEALRRALLELGGVNSVKEECREARQLHVWDEIRRQVSYAGRLLAKSPAFTLTALLTLAVCLGANLTIFAVIDSVLIRPLPFPHAEQLVTLYNTYPKAGVERDGSSFTNYYERRGHLAAFSGVSLYRYDTAIVGETGATEREDAMRVSPDFFETLGRGPMIGRAFHEEETSYRTDGVAILTNAFWKERFGADAQVIGKSVRVDGVAKAVVGVLPAGFRFLSSRARLYLPLSSDPGQRTPLQRHSGGNSIQMIARLKPGAVIERAQAEVDAQNNVLERDDPQREMMANAGFRSLVVGLQPDHVAAIRPTLLLLQAAVLTLLLIGAVNLVNLLLIRASARAKETAVRRALGAGQRHIVSEVLVETTLLTLLGGLVGLGLAAGGIRLLVSLGTERLPLGTEITFDGRLALVAVLAAIAMGMLLAAPICWFKTRGALLPGLQSETRSGTVSYGAQQLRHGFVIVQIALACVLLSGAGLLGVSFQQVMKIAPGFQADHVLTGEVSLPFKSYPNAEAARTFNERVMDELARQPGVTATGMVTNVPFSGHSGKSAAYVVGYATRPGDSPRGNYSYGVAGDYFKAMGFALRSGRFLNADDNRGARRVCLVDEDFARYYWPQGKALGGRLFEGSEPGKDAEAFTVVGVVGRVKQAGLTEDEAQGAVYYPLLFRNSNDVFVVARTSLTPSSLALTLRRIVRKADADLPVNDVQSMEMRIADSLLARRSPAMLAGVFSAIAVLLTALGTYGVLSYAVLQRRREIGVRMALGARPGQIRRQFFGLAMRLLGWGTALGMAGAWITSRAMGTVLFGVTGWRWEIALGVAGVIGLVGVMACLLPSQRAARISPMEVIHD